MVKPPSKKKSSLPADKHMLGVVVSDRLLSAIDDEVRRRREADPERVVQRSEVVREALKRHFLEPDENTPSDPTEERVAAQDFLAAWADGAKHEREADLEPPGFRKRFNFVLVPSTNDDDLRPARIGREALAVLKEMLPHRLGHRDDRWAFVDLLYYGPNALLRVLDRMLRGDDLSNLGPNRLSGPADSVARMTKRAILERRLKDAKWNLGTVAEELGLRHGSGALLRYIAELDLDAELAAARRGGLVRRGRPRKG